MSCWEAFAVAASAPHDNREEVYMENPRQEKVDVVSEIRGKLEAADAAFLTEYRGMSVGALAALRVTLRQSGAEYKVYKNTLARFAARDVGIDGLDALLVGPTGITFVSGDVAAAAKALRDVARTNPLLVIKGGSLGKDVLSAKDVEALADLPSREVLLAQFAGALQAPLVKTAGLLQALPRNMAYGLKALIEQKEAA
jgi:large subunit ribosomal protein L10